MKATSVGSSIPLAWALLIASFFLPTLSSGEGTDSGAAALGAAMAFGGSIGLISALTNVIFLATAIVFFRRGRRLLITCIALITLSFLINGWWLVSSKGEDLLIGYYVWLCSFAVLGIGLLVLLRSSPDPTELEDLAGQEQAAADG